MSTPDGLPPLRDIIRASGLSARKSLGQNFLLDFNLTRRIARAAGPLEGTTVVEVGPGPGGLTRALLLEGAARVIAIEKDERCLPALRDIADVYPGRLDIVAADAREVDYGALNLRAPARIVANLPYSVATPLLIGWLKTEAMAALVRSARAHVSARGRAPHRGQAGRQGLRASRRAQPMAHLPAHSAHPSRRRLHATTKGRFLSRRARAERGSASCM